MARNNDKEVKKLLKKLEKLLKKLEKLNLLAYCRCFLPGLDQDNPKVHKFFNGYTSVHTNGYVGGDTSSIFGDVRGNVTGNVTGTVIGNAVRIKCYFFHQKYMGFRNPLNKNQILYHCI